MSHWPQKISISHNSTTVFAQSLLQPYPQGLKTCLFCNLPVYLLGVLLFCASGDSAAAAAFGLDYTLDGILKLQKILLRMQWFALINIATPWP